MSTHVFAVFVYHAETPCSLNQATITLVHFDIVAYAYALSCLETAVYVTWNSGLNCSHSSSVPSFVIKQFSTIHNNRS